MEHDVVTQTRGAVDADEDAVFDGSAKAHCQAVRPCAWPFIIWPRVCDQTPSFTENICGASCGDTRSKKTEAIRFVLGETEADKKRLGKIQFCDVQTP